MTEYLRFNDVKSQTLGAYIYNYIADTFFSCQDIKLQGNCKWTPELGERARLRCLQTPDVAQKHAKQAKVYL